jgi:hypothetical protein
MKNFKTEVFINGRRIATQEHKRSEEYCTRLALLRAHSDLVNLAAIAHNMEEGEVQSTSVTVKIVQTCLVNHRAAARPRDVIAQAKLAKAARLQKWTEENQQRLDEQVARETKTRNAARQRITHQIDHAFLTGKSGSESVAKYITCHCNAPAGSLYLDAPIPTGATVLDEGSITNAVCAEHDSSYLRARQVQIVPCSHLEFFYEGIRQIAIKASVA